MSYHVIQCISICFLGCDGITPSAFVITQTYRWNAYN